MKREILVVEDDLELKKLLIGFLEHNGFKVSQADNGKKALELIKMTGLPDLVLTDLIMDEMEGIELIRNLKKINANVRVIAMSGGGRIDANEYLTIVKALGASAVLKKPFKLEELLKLLEQHI